MLGEVAPVLAVRGMKDPFGSKASHKLINGCIRLSAHQNCSSCVLKRDACGLSWTCKRAWAWSLASITIRGGLDGTDRQSSSNDPKNCGSLSSAWWALQQKASTLRSWLHFCFAISGKRSHTIFHQANQASALQWGAHDQHCIQQPNRGTTASRLAKLASQVIPGQV